MPDSTSGTPGADQYKVKGAIHWLSITHALSAEIRLYDRLFTEPQPDAVEGGHLAALNPDSVRIVQGFVEPGLVDTTPETRLQFERHGYFVTDRIDHRPGAPVFNRAVTLKDSWAKRK
jgi:glutaminyl-tRNA synthetase